MKKWLLIFSMMQSLSGDAATYYVSMVGDDSNSGLTIAEAFLTIQHASDLVIAGDSVLVQSGIFQGFYHTTSGTSLERILFLGTGETIIGQPNDITPDGINLEGADFIDIEGFRLENLPRAGIRSVTNTGVRIFDNFCTGCGRWGILTGFSENIIIEQNICEYSVLEHGIYHGNSADNPHILKNTCRYNHAAGIHMNADESLGGDGIISNAIVEQNIIYKNGIGGGSGINCDGVQNSIIQNNLLYLNHASGISLYQIDAAEPCHGTVVINNSILQPDDGRWGLNITNGSENVVVFNNVILSDHAYRGSITVDPVSLTTLICDYNVFSDRMSIDDGESNMTFTAWQTATLKDMNSEIAPIVEIFSYNSAEDFTLMESFSLIENGVETLGGVSAPLYDLNDYSRPFAYNFDIGCIEFQFFKIYEENNSQTSWVEIPNQTILRLISIDGKFLFQKRKSEFNPEALANGIYLFSFEDEHGNLQRGKLRVIH